MIHILWFTLKNEYEINIWNNSYWNNLLLVKRAIQWGLSNPDANNPDANNPDANNPDASSSGRTLSGKDYFHVILYQ